MYLYVITYNQTQKLYIYIYMGGWSVWMKKSTLDIDLVSLSTLFMFTLYFLHWENISPTHSQKLFTITILRNWNIDKLIYRYDLTNWQVIFSVVVTFPFCLKNLSQFKTIYIHLLYYPNIYVYITTKNSYSDAGIYRIYIPRLPKVLNRRDKQKSAKKN